MDNNAQLPLSTNAAIALVGIAAIVAIVGIVGRGGVYLKSRFGDEFDSRQHKVEKDTS
jgi:hypothetical protein